ncbi:hypothetical protein AN958_07511 [Leucoagaricus sp. SymC.cos]|nr:hypothetical protein AN958_07511 [Leucoagaricus sp. SymC.cos]
MYSCPIDTFLKHYAPFSPKPATVAAAYTKLINECIKGTRRWSETPSEIDGPETDTLKALERIIALEALNRIDHIELERPVSFQYVDRANSTGKASDVVYAYFAHKLFLSPGSAPLEPVGIAVAVEFKEDNVGYVKEKNAVEIISVVKCIMDVDPRRMWMYGITIEDDEMSLCSIDSYKDVGTALHSVSDLPSTIVVLRDAIIAVVLLALVKWMHEDISASNIIMLKDETGDIRGKFSDLEYATEYTENPRGDYDFKRGSPYFMPFERYSEFPVLLRPLRARFPEMDPHDLFKNLPRKAPSGTSHYFMKMPKYRHEYDLESLWWILVWIVLRVKQKPKTRKDIFTSTDVSLIYDAMEPTIKQELGSPIYLMHLQFLDSYDRYSTIPYGHTTGVVFMGFEKLLDVMRTSLKDVEIGFVDMPSSSQTTQVAGVKRSRQEIDGPGPRDAGASQSGSDEGEVGTSGAEKDEQEASQEQQRRKDLLHELAVYRGMNSAHHDRQIDYIIDLPKLF